MTELSRAKSICVWILAGTLAPFSFTAASGGAQEQPSSTPTLKTGITYEDKSSQTCEEQNQNNPYTGMDPLTCHGEMAPEDSRGQCSLNIGSVWKHVDGTCYYCAPITLPPEAIVVPMDQVGTAESQGFGCGADQADACMAVCYGGRTYSPPPGTIVKGGGPGLPPTLKPPQGGPPPGYAPQPGPAGGIGYVPGANPCLPQGPGGYDYCQNGPGAWLPAGCQCTKNGGTQKQQPPPNQNNQPNTPPNVKENYPLGIMTGIGNCIQSFPNLIRGLGYAATLDFVDAAKMWGITSGPTILQRELSVPIIGPNLKANNLTPYQQGVIDGQRLCGYTVAGLVGKGIGAAGKGVGGAIKNGLGKGGTPPAGTPGAGPTGPAGGGGNIGPVEPGGPAGPSGPPGPTGPSGGSGVEPTPSEPSEPPGVDRTQPTEPGGVDKTQPGAGGPSSEPEPITGGNSPQNPVQGNSLKGALTNNGNNVANNAAGLGGKYVELGKGPVKLGPYVDEGTFAAVFKNGTSLVRKIAKNSGAGYFNDQLDGQANGSQVLQKLGIDHPEITDVEPGSDETPASLVQQDTAAKYPNSKELSSTDFQKSGPAMQGQILGAVQNIFNRLAGAGYIMGDINPANFTLAVKNGVIEAIPHDTDMIMNMQELNAAMRDPTSAVPSTLNGSLTASGAKPYVPGAYPNAQALANQLFSGLENWLYNGPPGQ
ncbi:MAG TPA: hypothetical protein VMT38_11910 [Terracidiphilus sp.]|nr:hypothetical protein [Terracidiphilus sp.]